MNMIRALLNKDKDFYDKLSYKEYSNIQLLDENIKIKICNNLNLSGGYGIIYDGIYNNINCIVKISHDLLSKCDNVKNNSELYKQIFINLTDTLQKEEIIPKIYYFECLYNIKHIIHNTITYHSNEFIKYIRKNIFVLCIEKYDIDLFELYKIKLIQTNKIFIEHELLKLFGKLTKLKLLYIDLKLENIVIKLNNNIVTDVKLIDIDPIFCIPFHEIFNLSNFECVFDIDYVYGAIIAIYKQLCYKRSRGNLFYNNDNIITICDNLSQMIIFKSFNSKKINYLFDKLE